MYLNESHGPEDVEPAGEGKGAQKGGEQDGVGGEGAVVALAPGHDCGFVRRAGELAGVYELDLTGELPEIEGIALKEDLRGKGLGRALLGAAMERLRGRGCGRCGLLVATDNAPAFSLYRSAGFQAAEVRSRWFQMLAE